VVKRIIKNDKNENLLKQNIQEKEEIIQKLQQKEDEIDILRKEKQKMSLVLDRLTERNKSLSSELAQTNEKLQIIKLKTTTTTDHQIDDGREGFNIGTTRRAGCGVTHNTSQIRRNPSIPLISLIRKPPVHLGLQNQTIQDVLIFETKQNNKKEKMIAVGSNVSQEKINIVRLSDKKVIKTINDLGYVLQSLVIVRMDGVDVIASGSRDMQVKFWSTDNNYEEVTSFECSGQIRSLAAYEQNGKQMLACGLFHGLIEIWEVQSMKRVKTLNDGDNKTIRLLHTFKYENMIYLLTGDINNKLNLWSLSDGYKLISTITEDDVEIRSLTTFKFKQDLLIAACGKQHVTLYSMRYQKVHHIFSSNMTKIRKMMPFVADGRIMLAIMSGGGWMSCLDIEKKIEVSARQTMLCDSHQFWSSDLCELDGNVVFVVGGQNKGTKKCELVFFMSHSCQVLLE